MVNIDRLKELLPVFCEEAKLFFYSYGLADLLIDKKLDHVGIKALNGEVFEEYLKTYAPLSKRISYSELDGRRLAAADLFESLDAGTFGTVGLLEFMEPKPQTIATTHNLIDHIEIVYPNLDAVEKQLINKEVEFKKQNNPAHSAIVVAITEWGQELKFSNRSLMDITEKQLIAGNATMYISK